jgi:hypothetical protein
MNSAVVAEPKVALAVIEARLQAAIVSGQLILRTGVVPDSAQRQGEKVLSVTCRPVQKQANRCHVKASFFLAGDETGELYPLLNIGHHVGSEAQSAFDEPHAPQSAQPGSVQSFTFCFMVEYRPGEDHTIARPADYDYWKQVHGPFFLGAPGARPDDPSAMFRLREGRNGFRIPPAFYYRSVLDQRNFAGPNRPMSCSVINVTCNDYHHESLLDTDDPEPILERARDLSRAYLYWLQTEAPRDEGGVGYPELRPMPEATGTSDGLAMAPYIREGRRLDACQIVREQDLSTRSQHHARARHFANSVGLGCFLLDIHQRSGGAPTVSQMARPYQIPLGALVSPELSNFAVASKCIGVTQITNGAYRLHHTEWAIGEAAGELAAYCLDHPVSHPNLMGTDLLAFQRRLLAAGVPLVWMEDVHYDTPGFEAMQILTLKGAWPLHPQHLRMRPQYSVARARRLYDAAMQRLADEGCDIAAFRELHHIVHNCRVSDLCHRLLAQLDREGWPDALIARQTGYFDASLFDELIPGPFDDEDLPGQLVGFEETPEPVLDMQ